MRSARGDGRDARDATTTTTRLQQRLAPRQRDPAAARRVIPRVPLYPREDLLRRHGRARARGPAVWVTTENTALLAPLQEHYRAYAVPVHRGEAVDAVHAASDVAQVLDIARRGRRAGG